MKFEKYKLSEEACEYMQNRMQYLQGGDAFFIPIIRDKNDMHIVYNAIDFPPKYKSLKEKLYLFRISQYKKKPKTGTKLQKEVLDILIPRKKTPSPLKMDWLDENQ